MIVRSRRMAGSSVARTSSMEEMGRSRVTTARDAKRFVWKARMRMEPRPNQK